MLLYLISVIIIYISARMCFNKLVELMRCDDKFLKRFGYIATFMLLLGYYLLLRLTYGMID